MISASEAWKNAHSKDFVPETFVEITMAIVNREMTNAATLVTHGNQNSRSTLTNIIEASDKIEHIKCASLEENLWLLDGSCDVAYQNENMDAGYVSSYLSTPTGYVVVDFSEQVKLDDQYLTIIWSSDYKEYPTSFVLDFLRSDGELIRRINVTDNHSHISLVKLSDYDEGSRLWITVNDWNTPNHYQRIDRIVFGCAWTFDKKDIISYSHEQSSDLLCAELPKNSIEFSLDNTDEKWNPYNPDGIGKYLAERQEVSVRYGTRVYNTIEWIKGGTFYLSEWDVPSNGLEARFVARDPLEFMVSTLYDDRGLSVGTFEELINSSFGLCEFSNELKVNIDAQYGSVLTFAPKDHLEPVKDDNGQVKFTNPKYTAAEMVQMCVGAMSSVCWFDRDGVFHIEDAPWDKSTSPAYEIPLNISYSYPEITLGKPVKYLEFRYMPVDDSPGYYKFNTELCDNGVVQTIDNPIGMSHNLVLAAYFKMKGILAKRAVVSGQFRADPRADVFDNVKVSTKFGDMDMILTRIKYTYNGSFRGEYTAQGIEEFVNTVEVE